MSDLRVMEIPKNSTGLAEGYWLRWTELRMFLLEADHHGLADLIEEHILHGESVTTREITVRR